MAVSILGLQRLGDYQGTGDYFAIAINNAGVHNGQKLGGVIYCVFNPSGEFRVESRPLWKQGDTWSAPPLVGGNKYRWYVRWRYPGIIFSVFSNFSYIQ